MGEGRFAGQVAIVTGGSHGIGRAIAAGFAADGGQVLIADLAPPDSSTATPRSPGSPGTSPSPGSPGRSSPRRSAGSGKADVLVNDAAAYPDGTLLDMPAADWERVFAVNVTGTFMLTRPSPGTAPPAVPPAPPWSASPPAPRVARARAAPRTVRRKPR